MNTGDACTQVISLYKQAEALAELTRLDQRKYEKQHSAVLCELRDAVQGFEEPEAMLTLIRKLTKITV